MNTIWGLYQNVLFTKLEYKCINHFSHELLTDYMWQIFQMHETILQTRFVLSWLDFCYAQVKDICEISEMSPHLLAYKSEAQMRVLRHEIWHGSEQHLTLLEIGYFQKGYPQWEKRVLMWLYCLVQNGWSLQARLLTPSTSTKISFTGRWENVSSLH